MFSLIMHKPLAIHLDNVSKIYRLHGSHADQLIDILGLQRFGLKPKAPIKDFAALRNISLKVPRGHRIGIVGRNGAGKTTLLKLLCGNFSPTSGRVEVNGTVQALMSMGLGFHPEYTGRENVEASLQYNGLKTDEYEVAIEEIIEFCELGEFLDQPFKSYSLGMQARLMFAAATAIKPDILIVDEMLGAGDAYFVAKSRMRVEKLVDSGCTMLLVSHSMQQVMELCDEAIWLDQGQIRMHGESFLVVKAYEEYLHGPIKSETNKNSSNILEDVSTPQDTEMLSSSVSREISLPQEILFQSPNFLPHAETPKFPIVPLVDTFNFVAPGGISRWKSEPGLKICGFTVVTERGITNKLIALRPAKFVITLMAEHEGIFDCRYGIAIENHLGQGITRLFSPPDRFQMAKDGNRRVEVLLNPNQLGPGEYTLGISILSNTPIEHLNNAARYDLLSRSFTISVDIPESISVVGSGFIHSSEWRFISVSTEHTIAHTIS